MTAKKQLEEQRYELQQFIKFRHGVQAWNELLRMEGDIRKRRQKEIYDKQVLRQKITLNQIRPKKPLYLKGLSVSNITCWN